MVRLRLRTQTVGELVQSPHNEFRHGVAYGYPVSVNMDEVGKFAFEALLKQ
jgi:hypothetical protein